MPHFATKMALLPKNLATLHHFEGRKIPLAKGLGKVFVELF